MEYIRSVGRRKTSVARLYMKPGKGSFKINNSDLDKYFSSELLRLIVEQPLKSVDASGKLLEEKQLIPAIDGEDVFTVSNPFIIIFKPEHTANTKQDIAIL